MPYMSLKQSIQAIHEYRAEKRVLVDNAGKAVLLGAKAMIDDFRFV
jgi:hypothetical protein